MIVERGRHENLLQDADGMFINNFVCCEMSLIDFFVIGVYAAMWEQQLKNLESEKPVDETIVTKE